MNSDDPNLTAYALHALDPKEQAAFEKLLNDDFAALAEVEATRSVAATVRTHLAAEPAAALHEYQRAELFDVLRRRERLRAIESIPWWRRPLFLSAAAACVVVGLSVRLLWPVVSAPWRVTPPFQVRHAEPTFHFALADGVSTPGHILLAPPAFSPDLSPDLIQRTARPLQIALLPISPTAFPQRFLPMPSFPVMALKPSKPDGESPEERIQVAQAASNEGRRRASLNNWGRRLVPDRLAAPASSPAQAPGWLIDEPPFSLDLPLRELTDSVQ